LRPHNQNASRRFYRELRQNTNPADPEDQNPNDHPPTNPNVVHPNLNVVQPSANANLNASQSEMALHHPKPPRSARKQKQKNKKARVINNYYYSCSHDSVSVNPHPKHPVSNPTLAPSTTPSTSSRGPTKKIPALISFQLTKPVGYSFASNYVQGRIAKADAT
jgi:hypothetical protein